MKADISSLNNIVNSYTNPIGDSNVCRGWGCTCNNFDKWLWQIFCSFDSYWKNDVYIVVQNVMMV